MFRWSLARVSPAAAILGGGVSGRVTRLQLDPQSCDLQFGIKDKCPNVYFLISV